MKKLLAILAIAFLTSCSSEGGYQMEAFNSPDFGSRVFVLDTKTGEVYYLFKGEWKTLGIPAKEAE